jgi:ribosome-binding factor A
MKRRPTNGAGAPTQRQLRVGESLRHSLAEVMLHVDTLVPDLARHHISVTEVRCSPDLRHATCFVLPLGGAEADTAIKLLKKAQPLLRHELAQRLRLKYAPELHFERDDSFDNFDQTRRLFDDPKVQRDIARPAPDVDDEDANDNG